MERNISVISTRQQPYWYSSKSLRIIDIVNITDLVRITELVSITDLVST